MTSAPQRAEVIATHALGGTRASAGPGSTPGVRLEVALTLDTETIDAHAADARWCEQAWQHAIQSREVNARREATRSPRVQASARVGSRLTTTQRREASRLASRGRSAPAIARTLGVTADAVRYYLARRRAS